MIDSDALPKGIRFRYADTPGGGNDADPPYLSGGGTFDQDAGVVVVDVALITPSTISGTLRFPDGTAKFQFLNGTRVLGELRVSAHAPAVSRISTGLGSVVNGITSISWSFQL